jgi:hypothetical protein
VKQSSDIVAALERLSEFEQAAALKQRTEIGGFWGLRCAALAHFCTENHRSPTMNVFKWILSLFVTSSVRKLHKCRRHEINAEVDRLAW